MINGIMQVGLGTADADKTLSFAKNTLGFRSVFFDDEAEANLMSPYTHNQVFSRRAILAMHPNLGGGLEIWQFKNRVPTPKPSVVWGKLGILALRLNLDDHKSVFEDTDQNFFLGTDEKSQKQEGGIVSAIVGVKDLDKSIRWWSHLGGQAELVTRPLENIKSSGFVEPVRRACVYFTPRKKTGFANMYGEKQYIELWEYPNAKVHVFENRIWGDLGFIHLCLDVQHMDSIKAKLLTENINFTVDSQSAFSMDDAKGRFAYLEDPDGTLIELIEVVEVPIFKGLSLKMRQKSALPAWVCKLILRWKKA